MIIHHGKKSTIKEILYPEKKSNNKFYQIKNLHDLREREERNRKLKEDKINYVEPKLYKLKAFENVPSKLKQNTQDWITKEKKKKPMSVNNYKRPIIKNSRIQLQSRDNINTNNNVLNIKNNKNNSLFDNYYNNNKNNNNYAKIGSKENSLYQYNYDINNVGLINNNINTNNNSNINNTKNEIDNLGEDEINQLLRDYNEHLQKQQNLKEKENEISLQSQQQVNNINNDINNINNEIDNDKNEMDDLYAKKIERDAEIQKIIEEYTNKYGNDENIQTLLQEYNLTNKLNNNINNNINQNNLNEISEVPESLEQTLKKPNNEIQINKNKKKLNSNNNSNINNDIHKDFGKTPEYIKKYKMEEKIKKEEIKRKQEEAKLPPGTKLLSEEERLSTLDGLINSKKELTNLLEKMPITTKTLSMQNKKEELIKKLDEIEKAIDMFSKKEVYIKI